MSKYRWSTAQELMLKEEVSRKPLLVDPSTTNNAKRKEVTWQEVTDVLNLNFATTLTRIQVRKKYNDNVVYVLVLQEIYFFWN